MKLERVFESFPKLNDKKSKINVFVINFVKVETYIVNISSKVKVPSLISVAESVFFSSSHHRELSYGILKKLFHQHLRSNH